MSNPFKILGVPEQFNQDEQDLHDRFITATAQTHPDRYTDPIEQADAAERAADIGDAYTTLRDPESRANALLELLGGPSKEADTLLPPDLLIEVMEARENMEEAVEDHDQNTIKELRDWSQQRRQEHLEMISSLFKRVEKQSSDGQGKLLKQIRLELNAMRYFERMIEQTSE